MQQFKVLNGEYVCFIDGRGYEVFVGHVHHVHCHYDEFEVFTCVAQFSAHIDPGSEGYLNRHWCVRLFLSSDVRYDSRTSTTEIITDPEIQAGNAAELCRLIALRNSDQPYSHPDLLRAIGEALIQLRMCTVPVALNIYHSNTVDVVAFGNLYDEG